MLRRELARRRRELDDFLRGIRAMEGELAYVTPSLAECFSLAAATAGGTVGQVFAAAADGVAANCGGEVAFRDGLLAHRGELALTDDDIAWMMRFGERLGETDLAQTLKQLRYGEERAERALADAVANEKKWSRVFLGGGWLGGVAAALFFL